MVASLMRGPRGGYEVAAAVECVMRHAAGVLDRLRFHDLDDGAPAGEM